MNFGELKTAVSYYLDDLQFGYFTTTQVSLWLNQAQKELQKRLIKAGQNYYLKCVTTPLVVNQQDYVLPQDFKKEHRLDIIITGTMPNIEVQPLQPITTNQQDLILTQPGMPKFYTFRRNRLIIYPVSDTVMTLRLFYSYAVTDMVADTDTPDAPQDYHEFLALLAAEEGFIKDGRASELLQKKLAEYQAQIDRDAQERNQDMSRMIVETGNDVAAGFYW